ncbi:lactate utilization protein C [Lysinibacillus xylanilyticus]|uniref:LutC/YkgG family protein n=1 Tax=Lysinibacillus xylanilyticus TaxID=582475 RepID=UPI002B24FE19|nr:lactate utilization protein C [Lysinibacillus xylanilyticus]MEB2301898.1 lactate utilization protein C [Lysinibacillus xylanilyticus]
MVGTIQNRETFIRQLSSRLQRSSIPTHVERPQWRYTPQHKTLQNLSQDELLGVLQKQCTRINTNCVVTSTADLATTLEKIIVDYNGGPIMTWQDERFDTYGLTALFSDTLPKKQIELHTWDPTIGKDNITLVEKANIGITISDITLAESGTAVLFSNPNHGRTVSFLPTKSIILMPKSSIVPRMTQAAVQIRERLQKGETLASCVNFISGPSNSADIEMILVVGVHGPMYMTYIIIDDL